MGVSYSRYIIPRDNGWRPSEDQLKALVQAWQEAGYIPQDRLLPRFKTDAHEQEFQSKKRSREAELAAKHPIARWLAKHAERGKRPQFRAQLVPFEGFVCGDLEPIISSTGAIVIWSVNDYLKLGTKYPLDMLPDPAWRPSYQISISLSVDYQYVDATDGTGNGLNTICKCGTELSYQPEEILDAETRVRRVCAKCATAFRPQDQLIDVLDGSTGATYAVPGGICFRFAICIHCGREIPQESNGEAPREAKAAKLFFQTCRNALSTDLYEVGYWS